MTRNKSSVAEFRSDPPHERLASADTAAGRSSSDQQAMDFYHLLTVFSVSAAMIGVCLTAIGLILVVRRLSEWASICDCLLAVDATFFLAAMACSFLSMRLRFRGPWARFALAADVLIVCGMVLMVGSCVVLVWGLL